MTHTSRPALGPDASAAPRIQRVRTIDDLEHLFFSDGLAAVEVPFRLLDAVPLSNERRQPGPRLSRLKRAIRRNGYQPREPVVCRVGMKGRWVVTDGGHRITAAREVAREWWTNLFGPKVVTLYFLLFTTPGSWSKIREVAAREGRLGSLPPTPLPWRGNFDPRPVLADD